MILMDAGPMLALVDTDDAEHSRCKAAVARLAGPLLTSWAVFAEGMHMAGRRVGWRAQEPLWNMVLQGRIRLVPIDESLLPRLRDLMSKYKDQGMDLGDATLVVLAEQLGVARVLTLDSDFRVYRIKGRGIFQVFP